MTQNKDTLKRKMTDTPGQIINLQEVGLSQVTTSPATAAGAAQIVEMKPARRGRPPLGPSRRIPKLIQLDPRVDSYITMQARKLGRPYQSIINDHFLRLVEQDSSMSTMPTNVTPITG